MTQAICFSCGELKFGAFVDCKSCNERPQTDDELVLSLAMTDHYFDLSTLMQMGESIREGCPPQLDPKTRENLLLNLANLKKQRVWKLMTQSQMKLPKISKKWWKFW